MPQVAQVRAQTAVDEYGSHYRPGEFLPFYVPRPYMPQIDTPDLPALVAQAYTAHHSPSFEVVSPSTLIAHQRVSHKLALGMPPEALLKPVLVSNDQYVLDGNHRWWAHVHLGLPVMNIIRLDLPFEAALPWLFTLPYTFRLDANNGVLK